MFHSFFIAQKNPELRFRNSGRRDWWRRGESNPCPKSLPHEYLRAQFLIASRRSVAQEQAGSVRSGQFPLHVTGCRVKVSCMVGIQAARQAGAERTLAVKPPKQNQILRLCLSAVLRGRRDPGSLLMIQELLSKPVRPRLILILLLSVDRGPWTVDRRP